jgi:D-glutamate cyclase-like protein/Mur ligase-like protein
MNPLISSIENLIACDPGGRNIFGLMNKDQLRLAAQSLFLARRVALVSGFYILEADASETDGPPGTKLLGHVLERLGIDVDYITDPLNAPAFRALGLEPITDTEAYLDRAKPTHLVSIERVGRGADGRYRNMRGIDKEHPDRHLSLGEYARIKSRIFMNQRPDDILILPYDDPNLMPLARKHQGRTFFVSSRKSIDRGAWFENGSLFLRINGVQETVGPVESPYAENLLSAVLAARLYGFSAEQIARALIRLRSNTDTL